MLLAIIARPYTRWRSLLVLAMAVAFAAVLVIPFLQEFFQLQLVGTTAPRAAVGLAAAAGLLLEAIWIGTRRGAPTRPSLRWRNRDEGPGVTSGRLFRRAAVVFGSGH